MRPITIENEPTEDDSNVETDYLAIRDSSSSEDNGLDGGD